MNLLAVATTGIPPPLLCPATTDPPVPVSLLIELIITSNFFFFFFEMESSPTCCWGFPPSTDSYWDLARGPGEPRARVRDLVCGARGVLPESRPQQSNSRTGKTGTHQIEEERGA